MKQLITIEFKERPGILPSYRRLLFSRRKGFKAGQEFPKIQGLWPNAKIDSEHVKKYCKACDLPESGIMPILYPHVLASPIYMAVLSHKTFPLFLMGTLHLRNHIIQHRPVDINENFDVTVDVLEHRIVKQGLEFDFSIVLSKGSERLWESVSTWLKPGKFGKEFVESPRAGIIQPAPDAKLHKELYIPKGIGKKFARITSDYNPIHTSRILAPLFGMKRDIAHAMWACGNALGQLPTLDAQQPKRIDLAFKGPLFINNKMDLKIDERANGYRFDLFCGKNPRPSVQGDVSQAAKDEQLVL